jgi:hypothetical protein
MIFVPGLLLIRYKCEAFVPGGEEEVPTFPSGDICTGWWLHPVQILSFALGAKILGTNERSAQGQMSDSLVVCGRF